LHSALESYVKERCFVMSQQTNLLSQEQLQMLQQQLTPEQMRQVLDWQQQQQRQQQLAREQEQAWQQQRPDLRFDLNDRVVCNLGVRWAAGHIVGTDPDMKDDWCYVVKLDNRPGLVGRTISVPHDSDHVCVQEVCFLPPQMEQVKGAAPEIPETSAKSTLRFASGDRVSVRVRNGADKLENWLPGKVDAEYPELPGPHTWGDEDEVMGSFPIKVAYRVKLDRGGVVFCHLDNYTLIRREGLEPQTRVKGISKRMEERKTPDGALVRFDHGTERQKRLDRPNSNDSSPNKAEQQTKNKTAKAPIELTPEQRKALFLE